MLIRCFTRQKKTDGIRSRSAKLNEGGMEQKYIGYGRQFIDHDDVNTVRSVLTSGNLTQGPMVEKFEKKLCAYTGSRYCVVVSSGTAALHLAVAALELEDGQEGITSPNTFVATSNSMIYNDLVPVFADIDPGSYNIDPGQIEKNITSRTALLMPVHFAGRPCDMETIRQIAQDHKLRMIEDACHAIGSEFPDGKKVGSCAYSDMTVFSFHPVKTITTGEGGAITTNDKDLYRRLMQLRSHGIRKLPEDSPDNPGPWFYEMNDLGFNYRLTDIQAALGISQLQKIEQFKQKRADIVSRYNSAFSDLDWLSLPAEDKKKQICFHLYTVQMDFQKMGRTRKQVMEYLHKQGIGTQVHYIPVHLQPYYREHYGYKPEDFPVAEAYYEKALSLPLFPGMGDADVQRVINLVTGL